MARPYRLGRREVSVEETRERVLAAAHEVFSEAGFYRASLDDVATRAGVARATVYYQFKSKFGLLQASIAHVIGASRRLRRLESALEAPKAAEGLRRYIREVFGFWDHDFVFFRNVIGLAAVDPEAAQAVDQYDFLRREQLTWLVKRLSDQGCLRDGTTQRQAVDTIWLVTSFRSFDHLKSRSKLSMAKCVSLSTALADCVLADSARVVPRPRRAVSTART